MCVCVCVCIFVCMCAYLSVYIYIYIQNRKIHIFSPIGKKMHIFPPIDSKFTKLQQKKAKKICLRRATSHYNTFHLGKKYKSRSGITFTNFPSIFFPVFHFLSKVSLGGGGPYPSIIHDVDLILLELRRGGVLLCHGYSANGVVVRTSLNKYSVC